MRSFFTLLLTLALAAPAAAHLLHRGTPLSELSASSPVALIGLVSSHEGETVELAVEEAVLGVVPEGTVQFTGTGHHPPRYTPGTRVLVFFEKSEAPWTSRQTKLDRFELPEAAAEREALLDAVQSYVGLRGLGGVGERLAELKTLSLGYLESPSERLRQEAVLDLISIAPRTRFSADEIELLTKLASATETPEALAPGLVLLLTSIRQDEADRALFAVLASNGHPRARARAAEVIGNRHGASAEAALRGLLEDPAPVVRATAEHALAKIASKTSAQRLPLAKISSTPREGNHDAVPNADPN